MFVMLDEVERPPNVTIDTSERRAVRIDWWDDPAMKFTAIAPTLERAVEMAWDQAQRPA